MGEMGLLGAMLNWIVEVLCRGNSCCSGLANCFHVGIWASVVRASKFSREAVKPEIHVKNKYPGV